MTETPDYSYFTKSMLDEKIDEKQKEINELEKLLDAHMKSYEDILKEWMARRKQ